MVTDPDRPSEMMPPRAKLLCDSVDEDGERHAMVRLVLRMPECNGAAIDKVRVEWQALVEGSTASWSRWQRADAPIPDAVPLAAGNNPITCDIEVSLPLSHEAPLPVCLRVRAHNIEGWGPSSKTVPIVKEASDGDKVRTCLHKVHFTLFGE